MEAPELENEQEYYNINKTDWDLADPNQVPKKGDQVIVECMAFPMGGKIDIDDETFGFKALYYRAKFVSVDEESGYCELTTLVDTPFSTMKINMLRVVPEERVWEI